MPTSGLIIGKFYPPHLGHKYLIDTALGAVDIVTVLVCSSQTDTIPAILRVQWLRQSQPSIQLIILDQDSIDRSNPTEWIKITRKLIDFNPDYIFSSEDYGLLYAKLLGCKHWMVDKERRKFQCSGTEIRRLPFNYLNFLEPVVAEYFKTMGVKG